MEPEGFWWTSEKKSVWCPIKIVRSTLKYILKFVWMIDFKICLVNLNSMQGTWHQYYRTIKSEEKRSKTQFGNEILEPIKFGTSQGKTSVLGFGAWTRDHGLLFLTPRDEIRVKKNAKTQNRAMIFRTTSIDIIVGMKNKRIRCPNSKTMKDRTC